MKKKFGLAYYAIHRKHFCVSLDDGRYRDLTTGEEFFEHDDSAIRPVMPEDLLDSTILVEVGENNRSHYIRVSYCEVQTTNKINEFISVDVDKNGRLVGVKLDYPWPNK